MSEPLRIVVPLEIFKNNFFLFRDTNGKLSGIRIRIGYSAGRLPGYGIGTILEWRLVRLRSMATLQKE